MARLFIQPRNAMDNSGAIPAKSLPLGIDASTEEEYASLSTLLHWAILDALRYGNYGIGEEALQSLPTKFGSQDVEDVLTAVDYALDKGLADPSNITVLGGSHGGFLSTHLIDGIMRLKIEEDPNLNPPKKRFEVPDVIVPEFETKKLWLQRLSTEVIGSDSKPSLVVYLGDGFEGSPFGLYGSVLFMLAHGKSRGTFGFFWLNAAEMQIDVAAVCPYKLDDELSNLDCSENFQAPDKFVAAAVRNPVCNTALMVSASDIPDWCYFEMFGSEGQKIFVEASSSEHLALFHKKSPISPL
ncbi:Peptidase S9, prolyl oligopeptidase, catalytic domain [Dillenia turbinata]|uniref:Peptidase S9, prolyl oligopeptidase, catalytic domain n=1 Tax=Dillenia turbinata TaxID=194707 RepID=A0AAN8UEK4_9MAGN